MKQEVLAHKLYFDEKYNKPYVRIYRTLNGKVMHPHKYAYQLPNKRDYKYINDLASAVEMSCSKFKDFRKLNNINIFDCEYFKPSYDDSFYYNISKDILFVKVTKKLYESFDRDDIIYKYTFGTKNRKIQINVNEMKFKTLALEYDKILEEKEKKHKAKLVKKATLALRNSYFNFKKADSLNA